MKKNPVEIGIAYENKVVDILQSCELEAYRTNKANPSDPEQYKAGFDGGVDIIARYSVKSKVYKDFVFYIQCKHHQKDLTKSAISEVYAGMHARGGFSKGSILVVFATADVSEETRTFAKSLGVELILNREMALISQARTTGQIVYADYGVLMKVLLARLKSEIGTHDKVCIEDKNFEKIVVESDPIKINVTRKMTDKPKSTIECCLHCGSVAIKKHGTTKGGVQRHICKDCGKTFSENYGLITHYTHLSEWQWQEVVRATVSGDSLTTIARNIGTSTSTAWTCRLKIYQTLQNIYSQYDICDGLVESDGKYLRVSFKGCKDKSWFIDKLGRLPRHHMSRADRTEYIGDDYARLFKENPHLLKEMIFSSQKRLVGRDTIDANHQHICILTAIDRNNNIYIEPATAGTAKSFDVYDRLIKVVSKDSVFISDNHHSYKMLCRKERIEH